MLKNLTPKGQIEANLQLKCIERDGKKQHHLRRSMDKIMNAGSTNLHVQKSCYIVNISKKCKNMSCMWKMNVCNHLVKKCWNINRARADFQTKLHDQRIGAIF